MEIDDILTWTLTSECPIPADLAPILIQNEKPVAAFKTLRDTAKQVDVRRLDNLISWAVLNH